MPVATLFAGRDQGLLWTPLGAAEQDGAEILTPGAAPRYKRCRCDATRLLDSAGLFPWGTGPKLLAVPPVTTAALGWGAAWGSVRKVSARVSLRNGHGTGGQYSKKIIL